MPKLTLTDVTTGYASVETLNSNFDSIEDAIENTLSRDGTYPNYMDQDLDMNGYEVLNVGRIGCNLLTDCEFDSRLSEYLGDLESLRNIVDNLNVVFDSFSGDNSQSVFTLSQATSQDFVRVFIGGVYQQTETYTVSGTTLSFTTPPVTGTNNIEVIIEPPVAIVSGDVSGINYLADLPNAETRTLSSKLLEIVSVKDFGATGNGSTDDSDAINTAITSLAGEDGGVLHFPPGTYRCDQQIVLEDGVYLQGQGAGVTTLDFSQKGYFSTSYGVLFFEGTGLSNQVSVTATASEGAMSIAVSSISGFSPNDWIQIRSTEVFFTEATQAEFVKVDWVDGSTIYLQTPLNYTYSTSGGTVTVSKVTFGSGGVKDLRILGAGVNPAGYPSPTYTGSPNLSLPGEDRSDYGLEIRWGKDWIIDGVVFEAIENRCISLYGCLDTKITNNTITFDSIKILSQYGVSIYGCCQGTIISNNSFHNGRHHVTTNSTEYTTNDYYFGCPTGIVMSDNVCKGSWVYALDTHRAGKNVTVTGNVVESEYGGILIRCANAVISNNTVRCPVNSGAYGIAVWYQRADISITSNNIYGASQGIIVITAETGSQYNKRILIANNSIRNTSAQGIYLTGIENFTIDGNMICDGVENSAGQGVRIIDSKYGIISNNLCVTKASNSGGSAFYIDSNTSGASTEIILEGNCVRLTSGTITGVTIDSDATNCTIGINQLSSCSTKYSTGTGITNRFLDPLTKVSATIVISSGAISVNSSTSFVPIDTEGSASADDLTTINGGDDGQVISFRTVTATRDVTFKDTGGNLILSGDFVADSSADIITLVKYGASWYEIARSNNG